ncbi:Ketol-acid reductoisomerase (NAD(+)) [Candidatus Lokiarchaeum ossiferum]|uniref:Ketol-acid reductoisomerase (NADP(+)) n=1 Tax=Candidatus Lokiarchaeum ossiferum TaxID=2951803 RepID=A0ABY6HT83_9ARCH|nr:Ketol-acid reductoisomerase (NAD(+)) [Candidatus Lokiarchaeum sp. B-35]
MKIYRENDSTYEKIQNKVIAVIGYGSQGDAQANMMKDSGLNVIIGLRKGGRSWQKAMDDAFEVYEVSEATKKADVIQVLIPDEIQQVVYEKSILPNLAEGKVLCFSHGFNISYKRIVPPKNVDVIMIAPKSPGPSERKVYLEGFGVPALLAVHQDYSGNAKNIGLGMAKAMHFTRAGVIDLNSLEGSKKDIAPFDKETFTDLFGEQSVLCGGVAELIQSGFEVMVEAGYPPEMAYFEVSHELKLITDLIYKGGIEQMYEKVSNTAEFGGRTRGKKVIDRSVVKPVMHQMMKDIEAGDFAKEWMDEANSGMPKLKEMRKNEGGNQLQTVGDELRKLFVK